ncbi:hypothetical protein [Methanobrevibacter sp.]|uniref:hypothetical protein n=1 Tax=Methanobrevibacter sp. TaxID=66852 RepID=UPI0025D3FBE2|nr:hypothetical protein [Methanobrevibacter sp.]MBQ2831128.1 hypothetical protein [Methanobrevibacter sp.]
MKSPALEAAPSAIMAMNTTISKTFLRFMSNPQLLYFIYNFINLSYAIAIHENEQDESDDNPINIRTGLT